VARLGRGAALQPFAADRAWTQQPVARSYAVPIGCCSRGRAAGAGRAGAGQQAVRDRLGLPNGLDPADRCRLSRRRGLSGVVLSCSTRELNRLADLRLVRAPVNLDSPSSFVFVDTTTPPTPGGGGKVDVAYELADLYPDPQADYGTPAVRVRGAPVRKYQATATTASR